VQPERIGRYRVVRRIGEGGMGVVYEGRDDRLDRAVAIKVIRPAILADPSARARFEQEARAAARVNHPNICALYEFDDAGAEPFLVMELLSGESLLKRLERGPLPVEEVVEVGAQILGALTVLHEHGVVHRDLKPANVFLTPHGAKLVDFGLAQPAAADTVTHLNLTGAGVVVGTPQYMSPERLFGQPADERADVWAAAALLYELASGAPPFRGATFAALVRAIGSEEPRPLEGKAAGALDGVLRAGLSKDPARRIGTAADLAARLRQAASSGPDASGAARATGRAPALRPTATRFVALPLRILRPDSETDFLAFAIPDAVSAALASLDSVIVRAPRAWPGDQADARAIGGAWAVDVVLTGTLMRAGALVRVSAQLIDANDGALRWSDTAQAPLADLFQLQDALTSRIVSSLHLPLSGRDERALARQAPANAEAYALVMRANGMMADKAQWAAASDLYESATVLDPTYAPAWVGLGRARRVLAKWAGAGHAGLLPLSQAALARALALDPDLSSAHELAASVEVELGLAPDAMVRLLERAARRPNDVNFATGLVTACRYAGLLGPSIAAHARAAALDPVSRTSVCWTYFHLGDYHAAIRVDTGTPPFAALLSRIVLGGVDATELRAVEDSLAGVFQVVMRMYRLLSEQEVDQAREALAHLDDSAFDDPEGWFLAAAFFARAGAAEEALTLLGRAIDHGFNGYRQLGELDHWRSIRQAPGFARLLDRSRDLTERAVALYERAGGVAILGAAR
jgi:TolB-like protein/predicted Ser/Thr protein kinase